MQNEKYCPGCKTIVPVSLFGRYKARPSGLGDYCKQCAASKAKAWHRANKELRSRRNKLKRRNRSTEQQQKEATQRRQWRQKGADQPHIWTNSAINLIIGLLSLAQKNRLTIPRLTLQQRRILAEQMLDKFLNNMQCPYTQIPIKLQYNASIDHIRSIKTHPELAWDINNLQWTSQEYNYHKKDKTPQEFYEFCKKIVAAGPQPV